MIGNAIGTGIQLGASNKGDAELLFRAEKTTAGRVIERKRDLSSLFSSVFFFIFFGKLQDSEVGISDKRESERELLVCRRSSL